MASLPSDGKLIATQVTSPVLVPIKTTFYAALLICMPIFFIEMWGFLKPGLYSHCLLYTSPSPRDKRQSRMPSSA